MQGRLVQVVVVVSVGLVVRVHLLPELLDDPSLGHRHPRLVSLVGIHVEDRRVYAVANRTIVVHNLSRVQVLSVRH